MYKIGIIDDSRVEISYIMASILEHTDIVGENDFKVYELIKEKDFKVHLFSEILEDIEENNIQCLIIDFKLDVMREILEGIQIVEFLHNKVPEFPVIILTNVPIPSKENNEADPDKVYDKKIFINLVHEQTKGLVYNIERNIKRYSDKRAEYEVKREQCLSKIAKSMDYGDKVYEELIEIERSLNKYKPMQLTAIDEAFKTEDIKESLDLLKEYKSLLE